MIVLLSEEKLKNESVIQENVDPKIIKPVLKEVQSYYIIPILGSELYNDIQTTYPFCNKFEEVGHTKKINFDKIFNFKKIFFWRKIKIVLKI